MAAISVINVKNMDKTCNKSINNPLFVLPLAADNEIQLGCGQACFRVLV